MNTVFDEIKITPAGTIRSYRWYRDRVNQLATGRNSDPKALMSQTDQLTNTILTGGMYLFYYDPKHKETLPHYDTLPLVLPFRKVENGFYGINLHYLPYLLRFRVLSELSKLVTNKNINENTRIKLSWRILTSAAALQPASICVKHYLYDHIRSRFLKIDYKDWVTASQLPLERFVKENKNSVWKQTVRKI